MAEVVYMALATTCDLVGKAINKLSLPKKSLENTTTKISSRYRKGYLRYVVLNTTRMPQDKA